MITLRRMGYYGMFNFSYLLWVAPGMLLAALASFYVRSTFSKYSRVPTSGGRSGAEVAAELLQRAGVRNVRIERTGGFLGDHYDPTDQALRLSPDVYDGRSVSAAGVAAHEAGHAIQHAAGYPLIAVRQKLVGPARIGSQMSYFVIIAGILLHFAGLAWLGVILFGAVLLFEIVTVPVEIDASSRAKKRLVEAGLVTPSEASGVASVLNAAAFTYIAAVVTSLLTLLYFISQINRRR
jgi:Zn-dependent membrane protease YugP